MRIRPRMPLVEKELLYNIRQAMPWNNGDTETRVEHLSNGKPIMVHVFHRGELLAWLDVERRTLGAAIVEIQRGQRAAISRLRAMRFVLLQSPHVGYLRVDNPRQLLNLGA